MVLPANPYDSARLPALTLLCVACILAVFLIFATFLDYVIVVNIPYEWEDLLTDADVDAYVLPTIEVDGEAIEYKNVKTDILDDRIIYTVRTGPGTHELKLELPQIFIRHKNGDEDRYELKLETDIVKLTPFRMKAFVTAKVSDARHTSPPTGGGFNLSGLKNTMPPDEPPLP